MNRYRQEIPRKWWSPALSPFWLRVWRPMRRRTTRRKQQIIEVRVRGQEHLLSAVSEGCGVMIAPNHSGHADAHILYDAADQIGTPCYFLTAWQVFDQVGWLAQQILRHHGCFSIDREGTDLRAFKQALEILREREHPLVVFPEGEVYHLNDRITPFREGAAAIALSAAKKSPRQIMVVPCAIKYEYAEDPTPQLLELMDRLEDAIHWRPRPELSLPERIYKFAEGALALKEIEKLGSTGSGGVKERLAKLLDGVLDQLEHRYGFDHSARGVPERVKELRRAILTRLAELRGEDEEGNAAHDVPPNDPHRRQLESDLDDVFLVVQLYSYPGDYVRENPTIERIAETLDKFEEDVLRVFSATVRAQRRATVLFGEPIPVEAGRKREAARELTRQMEQAVQGLLDSI
ncbi:MAG: lysophospholipid acyltransferase family protein, partial [Pirellulales bacterium]